MSRTEAGLVSIAESPSEFLCIEVRGPDFEMWLTGSVTVSVGPWSGTSKVSFYAGELNRFAADIDRLYRSLTGTAELKPMEPYLELTLMGDGKGHIVAEGKVRDGFVNQTYLAFEFALDQTQLPEIAAALRAADRN